MNQEEIDRDYIANHMHPYFKTMKRNYHGPVFDAHTHLGNLKDVKTMVRYEQNFNTRKIFGIVRSNESKKEIEREFPDLFVFAIFLSIREALQGDIKGSLDILDKAYEQGFSYAKLWFSPRWVYYIESENLNVKFSTRDIHLNDPNLEPLFSKLENLGFTLLLHVGDPDLLYERNYQPPSKFGKKSSHLNALKNILENYPKLRIVGAHMAGQPENLRQLSSWLDKYPNLYVDTGSARWMVREFAYKIEEVKKFFKKHKERILFGTDLVAGRTDREALPGYYINRFLSFQALFETDVENLPLPIPDPENNNRTNIYGLNLSTLEKCAENLWNINSHHFYICIQNISNI
ncbi:MAG: amidohydrolase family protein [Candidatus Heimdallarchaeaceae archaeon]